jgi:hypothetical protein
VAYSGATATDSSPCSPLSATMLRMSITSLVPDGVQRISRPGFSAMNSSSVAPGAAATETGWVNDPMLVFVSVPPLSPSR